MLFVFLFCRFLPHYICLKFIKSLFVRTTDKDRTEETGEMETRIKKENEEMSLDDASKANK